MRILIKGGVWKNTEDEILKAAVMKYGLNQWARISSLLTRKSAKQCKARWYEWLDPAIRKTEWTREEDEKLLHLAKLMPTQWRTIAPIVGRTPAQCLERYEKLLDMAAGKESYDPTDDPRRLRPGEIDPNPESKPARPDPIDMDEDEKEMLSEARARLANTKGKKAKRKARERQLEEARRLATLQKKRELKAAGIEVRERFRRGGAIDYGTEVPFERRPAPGFYDTGEERDRTQEMREEFRPVTVDELEGRKRKDIEKELIKQDIAKHKLAERADTPAALARALAANEGPQGPVRRGKLMLPTPVISDAELEELARGGGSSGAAVEEEMRASGSVATRGLLNDYTTPRPGTGLRTPAPSAAAAAGSQTSRLMQEAANLKALVTGATPLLGGENPSLEGSDFSGVTPLTTATPALAGVGVGPTPVRGEESGKFGATPRSGAAYAPAATTSNLYAPTPVRDALGLNAEEAAAASKREELARMALQRNDLRAGLAQLPGPKNEYQVMIPELAPEDERSEAARRAEMGGTAAFEEDAADAAARRAREAAEEKAAELRRASRVVQRGLPRPTVRLEKTDHYHLDDEGLPIRQRAEALIASELTRMLLYEQGKFPDSSHDRSNGTKKRKKSGNKSDESNSGSDKHVDPGLLDEALLAQAAALLEKETAIVRAGTGHETTSAEQVASSLREATDDIIFLPATQRFVRCAGATTAERLEALRYTHGHVRRAMAREAQRADKLRARGELLTRGLEAREGRLMAEARELARDLASRSINLACFRELLAREERAAPERLEAVATLVLAQEAKETALQVRYRAAGDALAERRQAVAP